MFRSAVVVVAVCASSAFAADPKPLDLENLDNIKSGETLKVAGEFTALKLNPTQKFVKGATIKVDGNSVDANFFNNSVRIAQGEIFVLLKIEPTKMNEGEVFKYEGLVTATKHSTFVTSGIEVKGKQILTSRTTIILTPIKMKK